MCIETLHYGELSVTNIFVSSFVEFVGLYVQVETKLNETHILPRLLEYHEY